MHSSLSQKELELIKRLTDSGMPQNAATLAVVMLAREHARPQAELTDIIRQYQGLERPQKAAEAVDYLKGQGWLIEFKFENLLLVKGADDLPSKVADALKESALLPQLRQMRRTEQSSVELLGPMTDPRIYKSYLDLIASAQHEICLPMLATTPKIRSIPFLQERAQLGVRIRILLASPGLVRRLRGAPMGNLALEAIEGWKQQFRGLRSVEIRVTHRLDDSFLATCMLIDSRLLRFDVYDPETQRSLDGVMLQVTSGSGLNPNITRLFRIAFDEGWASARPLWLGGTALWWFRRAWQWWLLLLFTILTAFTSDPQKPYGYLGSIFGSVAATFFVNAMVESWPKVRSFFTRKTHGS